VDVKMLRVISGQKEQFFARLIYKLIEGGEVVGEITVPKGRDRVLWLFTGTRNI